MLRFGMGCSPAETVYADSHHFIDIKDGPDQVYFEKRTLSGRIERWQMILIEYDIQYTTQKAIKGSLLEYHLAHQAVDDYQSMNFEFPDKNIMLVTNCEEPGPDEGPEEGSRWTMVFDGAVLFR